MYAQFTSCVYEDHNKKISIQNKNLIAAIVETTLQCKVFLWADIIIFSLSTELDGNYIG